MYKLATLYNAEDREIDGRVKFSFEFEEMDYITQADLLTDWISALQDKYDAVLTDPDRVAKMLAMSKRRP